MLAALDIDGNRELSTIFIFYTLGVLSSFKSIFGYVLLFCGLTSDAPLRAPPAVAAPLYLWLVVLIVFLESLDPCSSTVFLTERFIISSFY